MKMGLACALPFRPKLLLLDEPFSGLDPLVRDEFMESMVQQAGEMTVLISSHELGEIENFATHVGYLNEGRLMFEESMSGLAERFRQVRVTLEHEASVSDPAPKGWLGVQAAGSVVTFVDAHFTEDAIGERVRNWLEGVRRIDVEPMGLRSIFTALARASRDGVIA